MGKSTRLPLESKWLNRFGQQPIQTGYGTGIVCKRTLINGGHKKEEVLIKFTLKLFKEHLIYYLLQLSIKFSLDPSTLEVPPKKRGGLHTSEEWRTKMPPKQALPGHSHSSVQQEMRIVKLADFLLLNTQQVLYAVLQDFLLVIIPKLTCSYLVFDNP